MPVKIPNNLPAAQVLREENIFVMTEDRAQGQEDEGRISVIRPQRPMDVGRMEKDVRKLEALYEEGYRLGELFCQNNK